MTPEEREKARRLFEERWADLRAGEWIVIDDEKGVIYPRDEFYDWFAAAIRAAVEEETNRILGSDARERVARALWDADGGPERDDWPEMRETWRDYADAVLKAIGGEGACG